MSKYKTLASNTALISAGTLTSKLLAFFMVRFYTGLLTPAEYGTADLLATTASLLIPLVSLGVSDAVFRFSVDDEAQQQKVFSIGLGTVAIGTALFACLAPLLGTFPLFHGYGLLLTCYILAACYHALCAQFIRAKGKTALFAGQGVLNTALVIGLNILFLAFLHLGITGYILSVVLADACCTVFLFLKERLWRKVTFRPEKALWQRMMRYSIPLIPTSVFWWITSVSDRYMITAMIGSEANGIYTVANKLPTMLILTAGIFLEAWQFSAIKEAGEGKTAHSHFYSQVWNLFFAILFVVSSVAIAGSQIAIRLLADEPYYAAWQYVPLLCLAMLFCAFTSFMGSVYMVEEKSHLSFLTSLVGAGINIALNLILIPSPLGVYGAAFSTFAAYLVVFLLRSRNARRLLPFRLYKGSLVASTAILLAEIAFVTWQLPGWPLASAASVLLLLAMHHRPISLCARRAGQPIIQNIRTRRRTSL